MSRLPSSRGSSTTRAAATTPARRPGGVLVQSPKSDIFVALLGVSLGAIVVSCLLLLILFSNYGFSTKVSSVSSPPANIRIA